MTLVLLPPLGVAAGALGPMLPALSAAGAVALHDFPGQGLAPAAGRATIADLAAGVVDSLDAAGFGRADVCGFGFGGIVALQMALDHPDRVDRLVVACASAAPGNPDGYRARARAVRENGLGGVAGQVVAAWTTEPDPARDARLAAMLTSCDAASYAANCEILAGLGIADAIAQVTAPTLVLAATQDRALPPIHSRRLADAIPSATYREIDSAAHLPWLEQRGAVTDAILAHLASPMREALR